MTFVVALTGSIASGKSTALAFFADKGLPVISADEINRTLLQPGTAPFQAIVERYGSQIMTTDKQLNKQALRQIIFSDPDEKVWLENLLHPIIQAEIKQHIDNASERYALVEIPLLRSKEKYPYINRVLLVEVDEATQINRIMQRDDCHREQAIQAIQSHIPKSVREKLADDIVYNNKSKSHLYEQLESLHKKYLHMAGLNL